MARVAAGVWCSANATVRPAKQLHGDQGRKRPWESVQTSRKAARALGCASDRYKGSRRGFGVKENGVMSSFKRRRVTEWDRQQRAAGADAMKNPGTRRKDECRHQDAREGSRRAPRTAAGDVQRVVVAVSGAASVRQERNGRGAASEGS